MAVGSRSTLVVHGRLATREGRLAAARDRRHGLHVMTFEQAAVRLAGGFVRPIDDESLRAAIQAVLPATPMGELERHQGSSRPDRRGGRHAVTKSGARASILQPEQPTIHASTPSRAWKRPSSTSFHPA
jgi:hypothetical protein